VHFGFTDEQNMLRESVQRFLEQRCPISEVRKLRETESGYSEELWLEAAQLGFLGVTMPDKFGGLDLGWMDLIVILEEFGYGLFPSPFIANTLAATAILENGSEEQQAQYLPKLLDGSLKASVALLESGTALSANSITLDASIDGDNIVLNGQKNSVMDPASADLFIVSFRIGDEVNLAIIDKNTKGVTATAFSLIDQTKRMGNLDLIQVKVSNAQILNANKKSIERLIDQGALAVTAEISGSVGAALRLSVDYANERTQFGHAIGHFQGVKHPLAEMYVDMESFRSLLYYGAYACDHRPDELSRITSLAKAYATEAFIRTTTDSIQIHGATGYMAEVDIHLYYLRSKWARPMFGDTLTHYERALQLRGDQGFFKIELDLSEEEQAFRAEVREFLAEHNPPPGQRTPESFNKWLKAVRNKRYVGFSWPTECGGYGGTVMQQFVLKEEMLSAKAPMLGTDFTGLGWVGPAVIQFGTQEQQERFLPDILDSKTAWCTGYSEPGVGSDLANLQCKAMLNEAGTHYVVNGQKIWISLAHMGTGIYCLVRTDNSGEKHEGISCLLIPLDTPGIDVRPIKSFAGDHFADLYNEVFFSDVKVPVENRIGQEGDGWAIICGALQNERSGIAEVNRHHKAMERLIKLAKNSNINGENAFENMAMRQRLSAFDARIEAARLNGMRALSKQVTAKAGDSEASLNKLHNCHLLVEMADTAMELLDGASPYIGDTEASIDRGKWQIGSLGWPTTVIGGGTPNIQKNIIAERILGLPKD